MWKHYDPSNICSYLPNNTKQPRWRTCIFNRPFVFYFHTFYSLPWGLMFQLMPSMRCAVNLLLHPWAGACERMREKCGGEMKGTVYRAGSLRNFRSAVAAAIVSQCNICWWIEVNYVATGLLSKLTNHWVQQNSGNFLTKSEIIRFSRMILV